MHNQICPECAELRPRPGRCTVCGGTLRRLDDEGLQRLLAVQVDRRLRELLRQRVREEEDPHRRRLAFEILEGLGDPVAFEVPAPRPEPVAPVAPVAPVVRAPEPAVALVAVPVVLPAPASAEGVTRESPDAFAAARAAEAAADEATDAATDAATEGLGGGQGEGQPQDAGGALGALLAVEDEDDGPGLGSWLYENIGWFLGATLVLSGSIYGVREAWLALGDVSKHLVVAGALLGYHGGFVGVGALLARSSQGAGRVLSSIGWLLLPVVFVALSSLVEVNAGLGLGAAAGAAALAWLTQGSVAARFEGATRGALALATLPALISMLPVASWPAGSWARHLSPLLGLVGVVMAGRSGQPWALVASVLASVAAWIFSASGTPTDAASVGAAGVTSATTALFVAGLAGTLREGLARDAIRSKGPSLARGLEVLALAATGCALAAAGVAAAQGIAVRDLALGNLAVATATALVFGRAIEAAPKALHLFVPAAALASWLLVATGAPTVPTLRACGPGLLAAGLLLWGADRKRPAALVWGLGLGAWLIAAMSPLSAVPPLHALLAAGPLLAAAHRAAGVYRWMHYPAGALGFLVALSAARLAWPDGSHDTAALLLLALVYGVASWPFDERDGELKPLGDLSLLAALAAPLAVAAPTPMPWDTAAPLSWTSVAARDLWPMPAGLLRELAAQPWTLASAAALFVRARLDRSFVVAAVAGLLLARAVLQTYPPSLSAPHLTGALALGLSLLAALLSRPAADDRAGKPRKLLGLLPLGSTATPIGDGLGLSAALLWALGQLTLWLWLGNIVEERRSFFVQGAALQLGAAALWFLTPALSLVRARGSIPALVVAALTGVMVALANRLGRPLPPEQVAVRLTVVAAVLWAVAELLDRKGEGWGARLGRPDHGRHYHVVATVGLGALGLLLAVDGYAVAAKAPPALATVPPMFALGAALAAVLLARRTASIGVFHAVSPLALVGAALAVAQGTALGLESTRLSDGSWYPAALARKGFALAMLDLNNLTPLQQRGLLGAAAGSAALALLGLLARHRPLAAAGAWVLGTDDDEPEVRLSRSLQGWAALGVLGCAVMAGWQASRESAAALVLTGLLLAAGGRKHLGATLSAAGAALVLHAQGFAGPLFVPWVGPALAGLGLAGLAGLEATRRSNRTEIGLSHAFALGCLGLGWLHALAVGAPTARDASLYSLLLAVDHPQAAGWLGSYAPSLVAAIGAASAALGGAQAFRGRMGGYGKLLAAVAPQALGLGFVLFWIERKIALGADHPRGSASRLLELISPETTALAAGLAALTLAAHVAARSLAHKRKKGADAPRLGKPSEGVGWGRDALLLSTFCFASWHVARVTAVGAAPPPMTTAAGVGALAVVGLVSVHAAFREVSPRHVYFVQLATVTLYTVLRSTTARAFPPEADAVFALGLGFVLVGVTVLARRAGLPPVARATKVFAALLPLGVAVALGGQQGFDQAAGALGSALLYGALAWVERSRALGALGAVAVNVALLLSALATGLDGLEIYLAPMGLFLLALGHLFSSSLEGSQRQALRMVGTLLLYLPAGWAITFQLGRAPDARYPLAFGIICLGGVAAGMALRIRAYLLMGSAFLVLDVIANLLHASLRNHRLGFAVLSTSGLLVLGAMVLSTLKRDALRSLTRRFRSRLASWD